MGVGSHFVLVNVDEIAGKHDQVGFQAENRVDDFGYKAVAVPVGAQMEIADLHQSQPVTLCWQVVVVQVVVVHLELAAAQRGTIEHSKQHRSHGTQPHGYALTAQACDLP